MEQQELTFGQTLMGVNFNPSKDPRVDRAKAICAELADMVNENSFEPGSYAYNLLKGNALRELVNAQMNVVKVITFKD